MLAFLTFILFGIAFANAKEDSGSCSTYGCGSYSSSQSCQCNPQCKTYNDCCLDFHSICATCNADSCKNNADNHEGECVGCVHEVREVHEAHAVHEEHMVNEDRVVNEDHEEHQLLHSSRSAKIRAATQCETVPSVSVDRRKDKSRLRIMEYNMEWLFTEYNHSIGTNKCPGSGCTWTDESKAIQHMKAIANFVSKLNPDILIVEEVSDCWQLQKLIDAMPSSLSSAYVPYLILGRDTSTGENCGLITKIDPIEKLEYTTNTEDYPIDGSTCGYDTDETSQTGVTKHFKTKFEIDGIDNYITLIGVHFIAIPTDRARCAKREAQAKVIASSFIEPAKADGDYIIVTGDFNDYDNDVLDAAGSVPLSTVTEIIKSAGDLINVASYVKNRSERYTAWYDKNSNGVDNAKGEHTMIDQFMMSKTMTKYISSVHMNHSYVAKRDRIYSDHWPIVVDLDLTIGTD